MILPVGVSSSHLQNYRVVSQSQCISNRKVGGASLKVLVRIEFTRDVLIVLEALIDPNT